MKLKRSKAKKIEREVAAFRSRDQAHGWANLIVGLKVPRRWLRRLSAAKFTEAVKFMENFWLRANDNPVRARPRPKWFPRKYIWPVIGTRF